MTPVRTCVGCGRRAPVAELVRVVARPGGTLAVGSGLPGRGAWLCRGSAACLERAARRNGLDRALRAPVEPEALLALARQLGQVANVGG